MMEYRNKRRIILGIFLFLLLLLYLFKNVSLVIRVIGVVFGLGIFYFLDHAFNLEFKLRHYLYIILILFGGILFSPLYVIFSSYDKILHFTLPILGSIMIFFIFNKLKIKFQWKLLITFTSMLSILVIHEIGEYLLDVLWDMKLQGVYVRDISGLEKLNIVQDKIDDTMIDLIFGLLGSATFAIGKITSYFYNRDKKS